MPGSAVNPEHSPNLAFVDEPFSGVNASTPIRWPVDHQPDTVTGSCRNHSLGHVDVGGHWLFLHNVYPALCRLHDYLAGAAIIRARDYGLGLGLFIKFL